MLFSAEIGQDQELEHNNMAKILVVDDDQLVASTIGKVLQEEEFAVRVASNGLEAVDMLQQEDVDLIICDVMMPEMDGYQFQNELNKYLNYQNIPFIFLSACDDSESKMKGVEAGADAFLSKPFNAHELIATVKGRMKRFQARQEHLNQEKEQFSTEIIRNLSHELRTPLLAVNGGSEMLNDQLGELSKDNIGNLIKSIWRGGKRLESLINNFLLIQQIQNGQAKKSYDRTWQVFDIGLFLQEYLETKTQELEEKNYYFESHVQKINDIDIKACPAQLVQILDRLFDNAQKFDQDNRKIIFRASIEESFLVLSIEDSGEGFDPKSVSRLTSTFYQHNRQKNEQQGGGLGLTICKFLTRINHGRIHFASSEKGALVTLIMPLA